AGLLLSEHWPSAVDDAAQAPKWLAPVVSSVPLSARPTTTQGKPPLAVTPSATPLAAKTMSFVFRPAWLGPVSYQVTHGTLSLGPGKAQSGSIPSAGGRTL